MRLLRPSGTDPAFNLALEEALFAGLGEGDDGVFMLWRNRPCVIVGRHQNALEEVGAEEVRRRGLPVVRRSTGGGAVYHDLGNLNFSFMEWAPGISGVDFASYLAPVVRALRRAGVPARIAGRNDLEAGGRKISGSAQRLSGGRVLHHGTLLVEADFEAMAAVLTPCSAKYASRGVPSVRARVANISEFWSPGMDMETLCALLAEETGAEPSEPSGAVLGEAERLVGEKYGRWEWNIGTSPAFTASGRRRFPWGTLDVRLRVERGVVAECRIYGDFFAADDVSSLERILEGRRLGPDGLGPALEGRDLGRWFAGCDPAEVREFLLSL